MRKNSGNLLHSIDDKVEARRVLDKPRVLATCTSAALGSRFHTTHLCRKPDELDFKRLLNAFENGVITLEP